MKILRRILSSIFFVIIFSISLFTLQLFLSERAIEVTYFSTLGILLVVLVYGLFQLISGGPKSRARKRRLEGLITVVMAIALVVTSSIISGLNMAIYMAGDVNEAAHVLKIDDKENIGFSDKIQIYGSLKDLVRQKIKSDLDLATMMEEMEKEEYEHLEIYYYKDMDRRPIDVVMNSFHKTEKIVEDIFGKIEKDPVKVIFYKDRGIFLNAFKEEDVGDIQRIPN